MQLLQSQRALLVHVYTHVRKPCVKAKRNAHENAGTRKYLVKPVYLQLLTM